MSQTSEWKKSEDKSENAASNSYLQLYLKKLANRYIASLSCQFSNQLSFPYLEILRFYSPLEAGPIPRVDTSISWLIRQRALLLWTPLFNWLRIMDLMECKFWGLIQFPYLGWQEIDITESDLDFEYPSSQAQGQGFADLLTSLRGAFNDLAASNGDSVPYQLTVRILPFLFWV